MSEIEQEKDAEHTACAHPKRHRVCIDAAHGFRCNWSSPKGERCYRNTHADRTPRLLQREGKTPICELFILRNSTYKVRK